MVITADDGWMNGKIIKLKMVGESIKRCASVETVIVIQRTNQEIRKEPGRDYWYHELLRLPIVNADCQMEVMGAEDPLR